MALYAAPGQPDSPVSVQDSYGNYIGGEFVLPSKGRYFENPSPVTGKPFTEVARSTAEDIELALDAAHGAKHSWGRTTVTERALILNKIADRIEANLEMWQRLCAVLPRSSPLRPYAVATAAKLDAEFGR